MVRAVKLVVTPSQGPQRNGTTTRGANSERSTNAGVIIPCYNGFHSRRRVRHQVFIVAVHRSRERIPAKINRQVLPGRLVHRAESRLRSAANVRADLRLGVHEVLITGRGEIDAEPSKVIRQECRVAHLGIHRFAERRRKRQLKDQRGELVEVARRRASRRAVARRDSNCALWPPWLCSAVSGLPEESSTGIP